MSIFFLPWLDVQITDIINLLIFLKKNQAIKLIYKKLFYQFKY